jgi:hypothetical protein
VLLAERDRQIGVASAEVRRRRADIPVAPVAPVAPGADARQRGRGARVQGVIQGWTRTR